jgi:hypothetical protein
MVREITKYGVICADPFPLVARRLSTGFRQSALPISVHPKQDFERDAALSLSLRHALIKLFLPGVETPIDDRCWTVFVLHGSG